MSRNDKRIVVPLSPDEFLALRRLADSTYRHPRDEARLIIRRALLGEHRPENANSDAIRQDKPVAVA